MAEKQILFLTHVLPYPLDAGAKVRAYYMLRHLAQRHRVTLVSFLRPTDRSDAIAHLREVCHAVHTVPMRRSFWRDVVSVLAARLAGRPALIVRDRSPAYRRLVRERIAASQYDALHVDQIKTARHVEGLPGLPPRLIDKHNVYCEMIEAMARLEAARWRKWLLRREARAMRHYESQTCGTFDEILAVTETDAQRLREMVAGQRPVTILPICVDPVETPATYPAAETRDLICFGAMFYPPNVDGVLWFLREVFPRVTSEVPDVRFKVVGPRPDAAIRRAAASNSRVEVTGYVENLAAHLAASVAAVVPLRAGSGMRVKILDAMAHGTPVVSTRVGAEGIATENGQEILLADTPEDFAAAVLRLLRDLELRRCLSEKARRLVESRYDWRRRYGEVDAVYERLCAARERSTMSTD